MSTVIKPYRIKQVVKYKNSANNKILDIGCGSHSASLTKKWLPNCEYTGVDRDKTYNNDANDLSMMDKFIEVDLTSLDLSLIEDNYYDVIIMSHIIEHLYNGDKVLELLLKKLKSGGIIYIEFPHQRSVSFPKMEETLNFFDDPTHSRIYSIHEVCNVLLQHNCKVLKCGRIRRFFNILIMPLKILIQLITKAKVRAGVFWDIYGFAAYVIAKKD